MKTILTIPETYRGHCKVVINHQDLDIFTRNILVLFLAITTPYGESDGNCQRQMSCALHLWYSAFLTAGQQDCLSSVLKGIIHDCTEATKESAATRAHFEYGNSVLVTAFSPEQLDRLKSVLIHQECLTFERAKESRDLYMDSQHPHLIAEEGGSRLNLSDMSKGQNHPTLTHECS